MHENMTSARGLVHFSTFDRNPRVIYEALSSKVCKYFQNIFFFYFILFLTFLLPIFSCFLSPPPRFLSLSQFKVCLIEGSSVPHHYLSRFLSSFFRLLFHSSPFPFFPFPSLSFSLPPPFPFLLPLIQFLYFYIILYFYILLYFIILSYYIILYYIIIFYFIILYYIIIFYYIIFLYFIILYYYILYYIIIFIILLYFIYSLSRWLTTACLPKISSKNSTIF